MLDAPTKPVESRNQLQGLLEVGGFGDGTAVAEDGSEPSGLVGHLADRLEDRRQKRDGPPVGGADHASETATYALPAPIDSSHSS